MERKKETQVLKKETGITLIALIITVIIIAIIATVSINGANNSGTIEYAVNGTENYIEEAKIEESQLNEAEEMMGGSASKGNSEIPGKVSVGEKSSKKSTINGGEFSSQNPVIPKNYYPINQGAAVWGDGTSMPTAASVSAGLVISDSNIVIDELGHTNGNEWVWVPVEKNASGKAVSNGVVIYQENVDGVNMYTSTDYGTTKTYKYSTSAIISGITRGLPNSTSYREPSIVVGTGAQYDNGTTTINGNTVHNYEIAGFSSLTKMAESLKDDYAEMIESIEKYGGFYIGRYELSIEGVKKGKTVAAGTIDGTAYNWYRLYADCKKLGVGNNVQTRMIWSNLWDVTCNWIASEKDLNGDSIYNITDSSKWGNYSNYNTANGYSSGDTGYVSGAGSKKTAGFSNYWKVKNIYDFAGNYFEWTQEVNWISYCSERGGSYGDSGSDNPAIYRYYRSKHANNAQRSSRAVLYVK